jgi:phosphoribosylformylglycinamidine synthase
MVGLVHDLERLTGLAWREPGDSIWLLGAPLEAGSDAIDARVSLAGSSYLERIHGAVTGRPPLIDLELERAVQGFLRRSIAAGLVRSAHDLSDGGLAVAVAEACLSSGLGAHLEIPAAAVRLDRLLFAEGGSRILVSVAPECLDAWQEALERARADASVSLPASRLGVVSAGADLSVIQAGATLLQLPLERLRQTYEQAIPRRMGVDLPPSF